MQLLLLLGVVVVTHAELLVPPQFNLAQGKKAVATATCGEDDEGRPILERFCDLTGATVYNPTPGFYHPYETPDRVQALTIEHQDHSKIVAGHNCDNCSAAIPKESHPASFITDGYTTWWQSPPLSRGMKYQKINITIDLEQEFHVAYVIMKMANSPRPAVWVLERSTDHGKTWSPWWRFAESLAQCEEFFGADAIEPIQSEDSVLCSTKFSKAEPLENGEIHLSLLNDRPGSSNFSHNQKLQDWVRATNIRVRLLKPKTLDGYFTEFKANDPSVTRRYFYSIKDINVGGSCVCHGHAQSCGIRDSLRPTTLLCECKHHTCGDHCEECCPGYDQKKWQPARDGHPFECERCNCFGHSEDCHYDPDADANKLSLDMHGQPSGGGVCTNCRDNTQGINCNECVFGYYRPADKQLDDLDVCQPCTGADPYFHTGDCEDITARHYCKERFQSPNCDACAIGYYDFPECKPCECNVNATLDGQCLATDGQCPCKAQYAGAFCNECIRKFYSFPECKPCNCEGEGAQDGSCDDLTGACKCKTNFGGAKCDICADGYWDAPTCKLCDCDEAGSEPAVCDKETGLCLCKTGYTGVRCDRCNDTYYGYPECKECACDAAGSMSATCEATSGQCPCRANFTGKHCSECAAGYYDYPNCYPCDCNAAGRKGITCDKNGQCYCKSNFQGLKCSRCKENFYNFPICEECNCDPRGVSATFRGCDKVAPGELCMCKRRVTGRICNKCSPTFWNLDYRNAEGCEACDCHPGGTLSSLNHCDDQSGQCPCKMFVNGRRCAECRKGYYDLQEWDFVGCKDCNCDVGGAYPDSPCDPHSGQCRCRPKINDRDCSQPIETHYFPTLWHMQYEAEEAVAPDEERSPVRYALDERQFPDFSWKGFVVFSPIQEEIVLTVDVPASSVYRMLFHYVGPTVLDVPTEVIFVPQNGGANESVVTRLPPSKVPKTHMLVHDSGKAQIFDLKQGRYNLHIKANVRFFLDYVVLLPHRYYEAKALTESVKEPCEVGNADTTCRDYRLPEITSQQTTTDSKYYKDDEDRRTNPEHYPDERLPKTNGEAIWMHGPKPLYIDITPEKADKYVVVFEYYSTKEEKQPGRVVVGSGEQSGRGFTSFEHCPYTSLCRGVVLQADGLPAVFDFPEGLSTLTLTPDNEFDVALKSVSIVPNDTWTYSLLKPASYCVKKGGKCVPASHRGVEIVVEAESGKNYNTSSSGQELTFPVGDANMRVVAIDPSQTILEISGKVPTPDDYVFIVHYYQPRLAKIDVDGVLQNDKTYEEAQQERALRFNESVLLERNAYVPIGFCPSISGCRAVVKQSSDDEMHFHVNENFTLTMSLKDHNQGSLFVDYVMAIPKNEYKPNLLEEEPLDRSAEFITTCGLPTNFKLDPQTASDYCKKAVFSLTSHFLNGALACECHVSGSTSFNCEKFGGQCPCKPNVIGRQCTDCRPGYFGFPNCRACACGPNQQCDRATGQCLCPLHVVGILCDACAPNAYGYDALIGCQLCGCNPEGSVGSLECDSLEGQCKCKPNVAGRRCDKCIAGYYGFPSCYQCSCDLSGSTPDICDQDTATCTCKKNVEGSACGQCKSGTFFLEERNPAGCTECFCFGTTPQCRSSIFQRSTIADMNDWVVSLEGTASVVTEGQSVSVTVSEQRPVQDTSDAIYLVAPPTFLGNQIASYGGNLSFELDVQKRDSNSQFLRASPPDIILIGYNFTAEHWSVTPPMDPSKSFRVEAAILPENWKFHDGSEFSRAQLMLLLYNLTEVKIRISYFDTIASAKLSNVRLDSSSRDPYAPSFHAAANVESCECPPQYRGSSCEDCAEGFYRVSTGPYLGSCVPCQCHGHSGECDVRTGICIECTDATIGDHCERCSEGYYGDATRGTPGDCNVCPCPHLDPEYNFATSCEVVGYGVSTKCNCKAGYAGEQCERCDRGFFGNPARRVKCQQCDCSGNNDLSLPDSCDRLTGVCANCRENTAGMKCEMCAPWYYGDAVVLRNCKNCTCNQCGAQFCDDRTGQCECKANVFGASCDRCIPLAYGFDDCNGCELCECAEASMVKQCDLKTGQCPCMQGATGKHCESCQEGYWSYGPTGCKKCDCEADLSSGTVCDVRTGQCQCMEGATGPRCSECVPGFLRVPKHGCMFCDECVHVLVDDLVVMSEDIARAEGGLSNFTMVYLTNRRLNQIANQTRRLQAEHKALSEALSRSMVNELVDDGERQRTIAAEFSRRIERNLNDSKTAENRSEALVDEAEQADREFDEKIREARAVVMKMKALAESLGGKTPAGDREQLLQEAEELLQQLQAIDMSAREQKANEAGEKASEAFREVQAERSTKLASVRESSAKLRDKLDGLYSKLNEHDARMSAIGVNVSIARQLLDGFEGDTFQLRNEGFKTKDAELKKLVQEAKEKVEAGRALLPTARQHYDEFEGTVDRLNDSVGAASAKHDDLQPNLNELMDQKPRADRKAEMLEQDANRLASEFEGTKNQAETAVQAATAYQDIRKNLDEADEAAKAAIAKAEESLGKTTGLADDARERRRKANEVSGPARGAHSSLVNELKNGLDNAKSNLSKVAETVRALKPEVDATRAELAKLDAHRAKMTDRVEAEKSRAAEVKARAEETRERVDAMGGSIAELEEAARTQGTAAGGKRDESIAREQVERLKNMGVNVTNKIAEAKTAEEAAKRRIDDFAKKLDALAEKVKMAREAANRIRIGAHFNGTASLRLKNPSRVTRSAAYTHLSMHFKTPESNGMLFFFGNEVGTTSSRLVPSDDYMALVVDRGHPMLIMNLGDGSTEIKNPAMVNDNRWHRATIERTGKAATLTVETEGRSPEVAKGTAPGRKSVFDLHQEMSKFYVGGVPSSARMPPEITEARRHLRGSIEDIELNGEPVGIWNFDLDGRDGTYGSPERKELKIMKDQTTVSFNGNGFAALELGMWKPRKKTDVMLKFRTYARDGLIFFIGKARDFLSISMSGGRVQLQYDLGTGAARILSTNTYNDGVWHELKAQRNGKDGTLVIVRGHDDEDGEHEMDKVEGSSPGQMMELDHTNLSYIGGLPHGLSDRAEHNKGFAGCIKNLHLEINAPNLQSPFAAMGVKKGCAEEPVRVVSFDEQTDEGVALPSGLVEFGALSLRPNVDLTLKFKPSSPDAGVLFVLADAANTNVFASAIANGKLVLVTSFDDAVSPTADMTLPDGFVDGTWHYLTISRSASEIQFLLDDFTIGKSDFAPMAFPADMPASLYFGSFPRALPARVKEALASDLDWRGCIGDVTYNGRPLYFSNSTRYAGSVSLVGCSLEEVVPTAPPTEDATASETATAAQATSGMLVQTTPSPLDRECALAKHERGTQPDSSDARRFGIDPHSRIEISDLLASIETRSTFAFSFRADASNGILLFISNEKYSDYIAIALKAGRVEFSFDSGSGPALLVSDRTLVDGSWHEVRAVRDDRKGQLFIDGVLEAEGYSKGDTTSIEYRTPLYFGGVPTNVFSETKRLKIFTGIRPSFGGCLRPLYLFEENIPTAFEKPEGVKSCEEFHEPGLFFGSRGGHAVIMENVVVGTKFNLEMEIKPRVRTAVLLSVAAPGDNGDYLTLQMIDGRVRYIVDNGAGPLELNFTVDTPTQLCDGHWHKIKVYKAKNLMTLTVDGVGSTFVAKAKSLETNTRDPLYLGGVPATASHRGLHTRDNYVGCIRDITLEVKRRHRRTVPLDEIRVVGDASKDGCPVN